jgi:hypothetical protein
MNRIRGKLTYANVISTLCLILLVGGGSAYAASTLGKESVGSKQLKKEAVTLAKIAAAAKAALKGATGPQGATGPAGAAGPKGEKGDRGEKGERGEVGPSTGAAGGALAGNYPNPTLAPGVVSGSKLGTITTRTETVPIAKENNGSALVECGLGETVISGGALTSLYTVPLVGSKKSGNGWEAYARNPTTNSASLFVYAYCLSGP